MDYFGQFGTDREHALFVLTPFVKRMLQAHHQADYIAFISLATNSFKQTVSPVKFFHAHELQDSTLGEPLALCFVKAFAHENNPVIEFEVDYQLAKAKVTVEVEFCNDSFPPKINHLHIK
ncbi:hypothetical protein [Thalassotalea fusca]